MKKTITTLILVAVSLLLSAQNYPNIINHYFNATPTHGAKIKTNIPFKGSSVMPVIKIEGYDYTPGKLLNLTMAFYIYDDNFTRYSVSGYGGSTPPVWLSNEDGKVCIFLDQKIFFQRFTVSVFSAGMNADNNPANFEGWTVVDEPLAGTHQKEVPYNNNFAGKVGIGTTTPQYDLDVNGTISAKNMILPESGLLERKTSSTFLYNGKNMGYYSLGWFPDDWYTGGNSLWQSGYGGIKFFTANQVRIAVTKNGNVGIGTVSPEYKLEVNGTLKTRSMLIGISNRIKDWNSICESGFYSCSGDVSNAPETNAFFWGINIGGGSTTDSKLGGQLLIRHLSSGNPVMYFRNRTQDGDGKWAKVLHDQGTQSINGGLTVDGLIKAREVKVQTDVWSDFVFAPDYNLPSLQEVESFIKENHHLPGVPSEKEVMAEGIDLAVMNAVLLQKIEELTLYIIEQQKNLLLYQKDISDQKKNIRLMQQRLKQLETK